MAEAKEEKKEKDPNNKITGWDILDTPQLFRKLPIGPSVEELQESKVDELLENKSRPTSHTLKDMLAFILGNATQEAVGAGIGAGINKAKSSRAISKYVDNILESATDSAKASRSMDLAARKADDNAKAYINNIENAYKESSRAKNALKDADNIKAKLQNKLAETRDSVKLNKQQISKNEKLLEDLSDVNLDDIKALDLDHTNIENLSSEDRNLVNKSISKFNAEETNKSLKKTIKADERNIKNLLDTIENFPSNEELEKRAKDSINAIKSNKDMLSDYLNGMSPEKIAKKYGKATQTYVSHPYTKGQKTAGKVVYKLNNNDDLFLNWMAAFGDDPKAMNFLKQFRDTSDQEFLENFVMATQELFDTITPGNPVDVVQENGKKIVDLWDELAKARSEAAKSRLSIAGGLDEGRTLQNASKAADEELLQIAKNGGKFVLGKEGFGIKLKDANVRKSILNKINKKTSYIEKFNKLISPNDPIHKAIQNADGSNFYKQNLDDLIKKGMSVSDAIQDRALERVINFYDTEYDDYIKKILDYDLPPSAIDEIAKPDFSKSKLRNPDGTLKSADELADFLTKDPIYIDTINEYIKGLTNKGNTFAKVGALEGAAVPLLARYAERALKAGTTDANEYNPFGKKLDFELPANMKPWDSSTEFSVSDKLKDNASTFFGINFDQDPNRFSTKQLNDLRQALLNANEKVGKWNPTQIEGWSDREILRLIKEIGNGKRPDIANEVIKEYKKLKEE